jgi:lycopene cyclase domain-containing protein
MNYLTLNAIFLGVIALFLLVTILIVGRRFPWRMTLITLAIMLILTAVFDNIMIGVGLVAYDDTLISGLRIGIAPIEDFAYTVAVCVIVPCVWVLSERRSRR